MIFITSPKNETDAYEMCERFDGTNEVVYLKSIKSAEMLTFLSAVIPIQATHFVFENISSDLIIEFVKIILVRDLPHFYFYLVSIDSTQKSFEKIFEKIDKNKQKILAMDVFATGKEARDSLEKDLKQSKAPSVPSRRPKDHSESRGRTYSRKDATGGLEVLDLSSVKPSAAAVENATEVKVDGFLFKEATRSMSNPLAEPWPKHLPSSVHQNNDLRRLVLGKHHNMPSSMGGDMNALRLAQAVENSSLAVGASRSFSAKRNLSSAFEAAAPKVAPVVDQKNDPELLAAIACSLADAQVLQQPADVKSLVKLSVLSGEAAEGVEKIDEEASLDDVLPRRSGNAANREPFIAMPTYTQNQAPQDVEDYRVGPLSAAARVEAAGYDFHAGIRLKDELDDNALLEAGIAASLAEIDAKPAAAPEIQVSPPPAKDPPLVPVQILPSVPGAEIKTDPVAALQSGSGLKSANVKHTEMLNVLPIDEENPEEKATPKSMLSPPDHAIPMQPLSLHRSHRVESFEEKEFRRKCKVRALSEKDRSKESYVYNFGKPVHLMKILKSMQSSKPAAQQEPAFENPVIRPKPP